MGDFDGLGTMYFRSVVFVEAGTVSLVMIVVDPPVERLVHALLFLVLAAYDMVSVVVWDDSKLYHCELA